MNQLADIPVWAALLTSAFVLFGAGLTLVGTLGLLRFRTFYERVHAPTLGATFGMTSVLVGSMIYFSVSQTRPVVHEVLICLFISATTPVTMLLLAQATLYRDRAEGRAPKNTEEPLLTPPKPKTPPGVRGANDDAARKAEGSARV